MNGLERTGDRVSRTPMDRVGRGRFVPGRRRVGATSAALSIVAGATLVAGPASNAAATSVPAAPLVVASTTIASAGNPLLSACLRTVPPHTS